MRVRVGAAKRHGKEVTIFDQPLDADQMVIGTDGGVEITFLAAGRYDQKSSTATQSGSPETKYPL